MKTKRVIWTIVFLSITLAAIVMEVVAGIFHPAGTIPWTEYLARYVPWPFQLLAYVILAVWLPFHFWRHDHLRKVAFKDGFDAGREHQRRLSGMTRAATQAGEPKCTHGYVFGRTRHHCGELPSDAVRFTTGKAMAELNEALGPVDAQG
jgi:hypothetical protein